MSYTKQGPWAAGDAFSSAQATAMDDGIHELAQSSALPVGLISMWSGSQVSIPAEWALCDGTNGTPDLRGRFVVGSGGSYAVGDTGGADEVTLTTAQMPAHNHSGSTGSAGSHGHSASTGSAGSHSHRSPWYSANRYVSDSAAGHTLRAVGTPGSFSSSPNTGSSGSHSHSVSIGSNGSHSHSVSIGNTGGGNAHENRPPYYALAYIMFIGA